MANQFRTLIRLYHKSHAMKVVCVNRSDIRGGPAGAIYRIHNGLQDVGIDSTMVVERKYSSDLTVVGTDHKFPAITAGRLWSAIKSRADQLPTKFYRDRTDTTFHPAFIPTWGAAKEIKKQNPDIIQLSWISGGMMRLESLANFEVPIVWRLPDMWPFTGGCHYAHDCDRYKDSCGSCPVLRSTREKDISRWTWNRKKDIYDECDITFVATSKWMKERIEEASLTDGIRVEKIPNGINTTTFQPGDKTTGRRIFDLPENKLIILFGAINPSDKRKGYTYLRDALENLQQTYDSSEVEVAIFGQISSDFDLPFKINSVGYLYDDEALSLLYSTADVMIVPSTEDVFPNTALEATACGTPVVAFNSTGTADIIEHKKTGYLAEIKNSTDLCDGIKWTLQSREHNHTISSQARTRAVKRYNINKIGNKYKKLYDDLV